MYQRVPSILLAILISCSTAHAEVGQGPLRVHPSNPRCFTDDSGKAVYLTGSHTWANFQERGIAGQTPDFDYPRYLDFMVGHGHNFMRLWRWEQARWMQFAPATTPIRYTPMAYERTGPGRALDGKAKFDLTRFNQGYFDRLRCRVAEAGRRGIYVSVMLFQGFSVEQKGTQGVDPDKGNAWNGHPYNAGNNVNEIDGDLNGDGEGQETHTLTNPAVTQLQQAYVRKVIDTLNDLDNVLWEISNESHTGSVEWQYHMIRFIHKYEASKPKQHPVGMTGSPIENAALFASPADWISPRGGNYLDDPPDMKGEKVIIVDTDHIRPWKSDPAWVWKNFMRGNHFILMDHYMDFRMGSPNQPDFRHDAARRAMGFVRGLSERVDLASMTPRADLASTGYCLANPGKTYLVYQPQPEGQTFTLDVGTGSFQTEWIDCETGETRQISQVENNRQETAFTPPFKGSAVLCLFCR